MAYRPRIDIEPTESLTEETPARAKSPKPKGKPIAPAGKTAPPKKVRARGVVPHPARGEVVAERPLWLYLCEPGLTDLLVKELKARKVIGQKSRPTKLFLRNYDAVIFPDSQVNAANVGAPRLALHGLIAPVFGRRNMTEGQITRLAGAWRREKADNLVSSVAGSHFNRQDLMRWLTKQLAGLGIAASEGGEGKRPCWLIVVDEAYYFGFSRLNHHDPEARARDADRPGALPPTIAAALAFAAKPTGHEVIWDPVCGSGTVLREAAALARDATLIGTDADAAAIDLARQMLPKKSVLSVADAASVDLGRTDVTLTLANLPWGRQYVSEGGNRAFYEAVIRNALIHAAPDWRGVFITSDADALRGAIGAISGVFPELLASPKVRGIETGVWRVSRTR